MGKLQFIYACTNYMYVYVYYMRNPSVLRLPFHWYVLYIVILTFNWQILKTSFLTYDIILLTATAYGTIASTLSLFLGYKVV